MKNKLMRYKIKNTLTGETSQHYGTEIQCYKKAKEHVASRWSKNYQLIEVTFN